MSDTYNYYVMSDTYNYYMSSVTHIITMSSVTHIITICRQGRTFSVVKDVHRYYYVVNDLKIRYSPSKYSPVKLLTLRSKKGVHDLMNIQEQIMNIHEQTRCQT